MYNLTVFGTLADVWMTKLRIRNYYRVQVTNVIQSINEKWQNAFITMVICTYYFNGHDFIFLFFFPS